MIKMIEILVSSLKENNQKTVEQILRVAADENLSNEIKLQTIANCIKASQEFAEQNKRLMVDALNEAH